MYSCQDFPDKVMEKRLCGEGVISARLSSMSYSKALSNPDVFTQQATSADFIGRLENYDDFFEQLPRRLFDLRDVIFVATAT